MRLFRMAIGYFTLLGDSDWRKDHNMLLLGRNLWWIGPPIELVVGGVAAIIGMLLHSYTNSVGIAAAGMLVALNGLRGFRIIDGFSDLAEALFLSLTQPRIEKEALWDVVRSPQNGPYGTVLINLLVLFEWTCLAALLGHSVIGFAGFIVAILISRFSSNLSVAAPNNIRAKSDFVLFAAEMSNRYRIFGMTLVTLALSFLAVYIAQGAIEIKSGVMVLGCFLIACISSWTAKLVIIWKLGEMNGDIIGFTQAVAEV